MNIQDRVRKLRLSSFCCAAALLPMAPVAAAEDVAADDQTVSSRDIVC